MSVNSCFTPDMFATTPPLSSSRFKLHDLSSERADCQSVLLENPLAESLLSLCIRTNPSLTRVRIVIIIFMNAISH